MPAFRQRPCWATRERVPDQVVGGACPRPWMLAASAGIGKKSQIAALYGQLVRLTPTPVIALNHAVAVGMARGASEGLALLERVGSAADLDRYQPYHAARADLLRRLERKTEAAAAYERALALTTNVVEAEHLGRQLKALAL